mgnify:CR=1 FL=1
MVFLDREKLKPQNFKAEMCLLPLILVLREANIPIPDNILEAYQHLELELDMDEIRLEDDVVDYIVSK